MAQTYEEAVIKTVLWWSEAIQKPMNQNNGDDSSGGATVFALMNMVSMKAQEKITPEQITIFEDALTEILMRPNNRGYLSVDYAPCNELTEAAEKAKLNLRSFPCKSSSSIGSENVATAGMGYRSKMEVL